MYVNIPIYTSIIIVYIKFTLKSLDVNTCVNKALRKQVIFVAIDDEFCR